MFAEQLNDVISMQPVDQNPGTLVVSMDFEIGWGAIENGYWKSRQERGVYEDQRRAMKKLVASLDSLEVSLTWATVGAMLENPDSEKLSHLPKTARASIRHFIDTSAESTRDGRDLFDMVIGAKTKQEIGSHTYSHTRFTYPGFDLPARNIDLEHSVSTLADQGVRNPVSFVYPLNHSGCVDSVLENGFQLARIAPVAFRSHHNRASKLKDALISPPPMSYQSTVSERLKLHSGSLFFNWRTGSSAPVRKIIIERQCRRGLDYIVKNGGVFHIWLHPFNLTETKGLLDGLIEFLTSATLLRDQGLIAIRPMGQLV